VQLAAPATQVHEVDTGAKLEPDVIVFHALAYE